MVTPHEGYVDVELEVGNHYTCDSYEIQDIPQNTQYKQAGLDAPPKKLPKGRGIHAWTGFIRMKKEDERHLLPQLISYATFDPRMLAVKKPMFKLQPNYLPLSDEQLSNIECYYKNNELCVSFIGNEARTFNMPIDIEFRPELATTSVHPCKVLKVGNPKLNVQHQMILEGIGNLLPYTITMNKSVFELIKKNAQKSSLKTPMTNTSSKFNQMVSPDTRQKFGPTGQQKQPFLIEVKGQTIGFKSLMETFNPNKVKQQEQYQQSSQSAITNSPYNIVSSKLISNGIRFQ